MKEKSLGTPLKLEKNKKEKENENEEKENENENKSENEGEAEDAEVDLDTALGCMDTWPNKLVAKELKKNKMKNLKVPAMQIQTHQLAMNEALKSKLNHQLIN